MCAIQVAFDLADGDEREIIFRLGANKNVRGRGGLSWSGTGVNSTTSPAFTQVAIFGTNTCDGNTRTILNHPLLNNKRF